MLHHVRDRLTLPDRYWPHSRQTIILRREPCSQPGVDYRARKSALAVAPGAPGARGSPESGLDERGAQPGEFPGGHAVRDQVTGAAVVPSVQLEAALARWQRG